MAIRSNSVMTCETAGYVHTWTFSDGEKLAFDARRSPETAEMAMMHGYKQKIADAAAQSRDATTGKPATVAEKRAAMQAVVAQLYENQWNAPREGGNIALLVAALVAVKPGVDEARVRARVESWTDEQRKAMFGRADIIKAVADIRAARAKETGADKLADALFDEID